EYHSFLLPSSILIRNGRRHGHDYQDSPDHLLPARSSVVPRERLCLSRVDQPLPPLPLLHSSCSPCHLVLLPERMSSPPPLHPLPPCCPEDKVL
ncbi:hypothetical protein PMAYCL1PPCAC_24201, partial [Pristionchus mayeri]